ncbi:MAG: LysM peptidoglycan-binding domain-containing protein [Candidatus Omnitrophica bacterium]|nr:LysM peptidoglycan-binding domain-containing protein [Candidatus Omnitrophota bacterium]
MKNFYITILIFTFYLLNFSGCATLPPVGPAVSPQVPGIYHRVERGQTLWRISKMYDVDLNEIARINRIGDATNIEVGQLIFIPRQNKPQYHAEYKSSNLDDFIWPLRGKVIASFGQNFNNMVNKGLNIQPYRTQNVVAASGGKVVFSSDNFESFGKTIIIDHGNGFMTVYAKNSQIFVRPGELVQKGSLIAKVDNYLHFQIRKGHIAQNPYFYLSP